MKPITDITKLIKSSHLVVIQSDEQYIAHNSLFGHPTVFNQQGLEILNLFSRPTTPLEIKQKYSIRGLNSQLRVFTENRLLIRPSIHERTLLKRMVHRGIQRIIKGSNLMSLGLILEESCNFDCPHCVALKLLKVSHRSSPNAQRMTLDAAHNAIDKFIAFVRQHGHSTVEVYFGGSEPLLNWEVFTDSIEYCKHQYGREFKFKFSTNSNASLINTERAKFLAKHRVTVTSSLDGLQATNDASRMYRSGKGTYQEIIAGWDELSHVRKPMRWFSVTLTDANIDRLDKAFFEFLQAKGIRTCTIEPDLIEPLNRPASEVVTALFRFKDLGKQHGVEVGGMWEKAYFNMFPPKRHRSLFNCSTFTGRAISVLPSGNIVACSYSGTRIGHINDLEALFASQSFRTFINSRAAGNIPVCQDCELEGQCMGGCYLTPEFCEYTGSPAAFDYRCEIFKLATRTLLKSMAAT